ncbi:MAG TPA: hypothetical protein VG820_13250 [Fimbriimonadaceae bacterium]|nr:hypothetical protein [Fimbriimonadaceae bacterium]
MSDLGDDPSWLRYQDQMNQENLRTLEILHRVYGGITAVLSCCVAGYVTFVMGIIGFAISSDPHTKGPPAAMAGVFVFVWGAIICLIFALSIVNFLCANWLRDRRNWTGVVVVSALNCLHMPLGTALGVFTLIVVNRPNVRSLFN